MKKLASYLKAGKGHGLKLVLVVSLLLSILAGGVSYWAQNMVMNHPSTTDFVNNFPTLQIKDGTIQGPDMQWARMVPFTKSVWLIDTSKDTITLPKPDGIYMTRTRLYAVQQNEVTEVVFAQTEQLRNTTFSGDDFRQPVGRTVGFAAAFTFVSVWVFFLIYVALTALIGWIFRRPLGNGRVWRVVAFVWTLFLVLVLGLFFAIPEIISLFLSTLWSNLVTPVISVILLIFLKKE